LLDSSSQSTAIVLSHPNHELAIFGLLQRTKAKLIFLTDGGGGSRILDSKKGVASINLLDRAVFLNYPEAQFYQSLCDRDDSFFRTVAGKVSALLKTWRPRQILCDAVEFYNPVHDLSLPIVVAALEGPDAKALFEIPLMHQNASPAESYEVQRLPASRRNQQIEIHLSDAELHQKLSAANQIYARLISELGLSIADLPDSQLSTEVVAPATLSISKPAGDQTLRYNWRGELRVERGDFSEAITYQKHYVPVASALMSRLGCGKEFS
jgi:hypothetical protein